MKKLVCMLAALMICAVSALAAGEGALTVDPSEISLTLPDNAEVIGKPESAISAIVNGHCSISVEMAWLLAQALGTTPEFWLNLESTYRLKTFDASAMPKVEALA